MVSKSTIKRLQSLKVKKYRYKEGVFVVEGAKSLLEAHGEGWPLEQVWLSEAQAHAWSHLQWPAPVHVVSPPELKSLSLLTTNQEGLALARIKQDQPLPADLPVYLALEGIRDPGNLGTLIRLADWYGLGHVLCSPDCVDAYHPKVVQASMGSFTRVQVHSLPLAEAIGQLGVPVVATHLEGEPLASFGWPSQAVLVVGSESHGLSAALARLADHHVTIPRRGGAESLNAAVAAGIFLDRALSERP